MHFYVAIAVSIGYGAILSPYQGVYGITQIELFGLDKLTASYGMSYFVQGVGVTIGPVLTGIIGLLSPSLIQTLNKCYYYYNFQDTHLNRTRN